MKLIATIICIFFSFSILFQENTIKGKYEMQFEEKFKSQNCIINFEMDTYQRKLPDGKIIKGTIEYSDQLILLTDKKTSLQMELFKREIKNDTIYFKTKDLREGENKKKGIIIYSGKLIRYNKK